MRKLHLDSSGINDIVRSDTTWEMVTPIADDLYLSFVDRLFRAYEEIILSQSDEVFDVVLIDYTFLIFIAQHLHMNAVTNICSQSNIEIKLDDHFRALVYPDWQTLGAWYQAGISNINWIMHRLRSGYHTYQYKNIPLVQRIRGSLGCGSTWSIGKRDWIKTEFIEAANIDCLQQLEPQLLLHGLSFDDKPSVDYRKLIIDPVFDVLTYANNVFVRGADIDNISKTWDRRLRNVESVYSFFRVAKRKPSELLVTGGTNPYRKAMVLAYQREEVDVKVFHHGNDIGARVLEHVHRAEVSHCKEFICPTKKIAANYERSYASLPTEKRTGTKYSYLGSRYYREIYDRVRKSHPIREINNIMIVGRPLNNLRLLDAHGGFYLHKIDLESRLTNILYSFGNKVLYKMHPEWCSIAQIIYKDQNCQLVSGNFEDVWQKADAFVFTTATTTTFEYSLCTNRPVLLLDACGNMWQKQLKAELMKRCEILEYKVDEHGSAILHSEEIMSGLHQAVKKKDDDSFLNMFL